MGAGKSKLAAELAALDLRTSIVSRDLIREKYFHCQGLLSEEDEAAVSDREMAECIAYLDRGDRVIIDATNLRPRHVQRWQHLAHSRGSECVIVDVHAPLETCIAAVAHRVRLGGHHVDPEVIRQTYRAHRPGTWYPPAHYSIGIPPRQRSGRGAVTSGITVLAPPRTHTTMASTPSGTSRNRSGRRQGCGDSNPANVASPAIPRSCRIRSPRDRNRHIRTTGPIRNAGRRHRYRRDSSTGGHRPRLQRASLPVTA